MKKKREKKNLKNKLPLFSQAVTSCFFSFSIFLQRCQ